MKNALGQKQRRLLGLISLLPLVILFQVGMVSGDQAFQPRPSFSLYCQSFGCSSSHTALQGAPLPLVSKLTPKPTIQPKKVIQTARNVSGVEQWRYLVAQYNWPVQTALAIMQCESGGNPNNISPVSINYDHISDFGLMQLHGVDILDPAANVAYAYYHKYLPAHGFTPWSTFNNGCYKQYLNV